MSARRSSIDAADIALSGPDLVADEPHRVAASLRPLGGRFTEPPAGFLDLGAEVPGHGDHFVALDPPEPATLALDLEGTASTHADLLASVARTAPAGSSSPAASGAMPSSSPRPASVAARLSSWRPPHPSRSHA